MFKKNKITISLVLASLLMLFFGFKKLDTEGQLAKVNTNDVYAFIAVNNVLMWQANNGDGSHDPTTDGNGFYWPGGRNATKSAIFEDGLLWGGFVDGDVRVGGNTYRSGLQAGKILEDGTADDANLDKYRVYKIRKGWEALTLDQGYTQLQLDNYKKDYEEWPVEDGAPWVDANGDGVYNLADGDTPEFIGDEVLWFVANDFDESRTVFLYGKPSMGLEVQATIFAFDKADALGDIVFKKYTIINKGQNTIEDMVLGMWSDTDLGDASDDYTGSDVDLVLGYTYNGDNDDDVYNNTAPPAVGYDFFQGPIVPATGADSAKFLGEWRNGFKNLGLSSFSVYINGDPNLSDPNLGEAIGSEQMYNYMTSRIGNGNDYVDPNTGEIVQYVLTGDPVAGTGWYEGPGWPGGPAKGDRRHVMASGTFTMVPGDTQEVVVGLVIAIGKDNINSVSKLKKKSLIAQNAYDFDFQIPESPPQPNFTAITGNKSVTLYWEDNAESYNSLTYEFEGYQVWQYSDETGSDAVVVATFDKVNFIKEIFDDVDFEGIDVRAPVIFGPNVGLSRSITLTTDKYNNQPLINDKNYYFSVTAYGYSPQRVPEGIVSSSGKKLIVQPQTAKIDVSYAVDPNEFVEATKSGGFADGFMGIKVIDPLALTGNTYEFTFDADADENLLLNFINVTENDTIIYNSSIFPSITDTAKVIDGFMVVAQDIAFDSLGNSYSNNAIKEVVEYKGPGGADITAVDVLDGNLNSTSSWSISGGSFGALSDSKSDINWDNKAGRAAFELRFTTQGSEFYLTGNAGGFLNTAPFKNDPKAAGKVPFEVWYLGDDLASDADDLQMIVKIVDTDKDGFGIADGAWTQFPANNADRANQWEMIYAYIPQDSVYAEPLADESGLSNRFRAHHKIGGIIFTGDQPAEGTVVRIDTWKPLTVNDSYSITTQVADLDDYKVSAKDAIDNISVFPNPYFGANKYERDRYQRFVTFSNLPTKATVRIFTIAGIFINKLEKDDATQYLRWDLRNVDNLPVASGMYIAYVTLPGIGKKIFKLAIIQEQQILDRL